MKQLFNPQGLRTLRMPWLLFFLSIIAGVAIDRKSTRLNSSHSS